MRADPVGDKGELPAVGRPGVHVDGALSAEELDDRVQIGAVRAHDADLDVFVRDMLARLNIALAVADHGNQLPVRGNVREPGVPFAVKGHLGLFRAVCLHAECLHEAGAHRIEPDVFAGGIILAAVIEAGCIRQALFFSAEDRDGIDVILPAALGTVGECFPVGRPAVEVAGGKRCDEARDAAGHGDRIDAGLAVLKGSVTDRDLGAVRGEDVVIVAVVDKAGIDFINRAAVQIIPENAAVAVVDQGFSVRRPVRRFDERVKKVDGFALSGDGVIDFKEGLVVIPVPDAVLVNHGEHHPV